MTSQRSNQAKPEYEIATGQMGQMPLFLQQFNGIEQKKKKDLTKLGMIDLTAKCNFVWVQIPMHQLYLNIFEVY